MAPPLPLPHATPESQGVPTSAVRALIHALDGLDALHGLVVVRNGHIIAEAQWNPYRADEPQHVYSVSKSFMSTAVGFAIAEGLFGLDDLVVDLVPESCPRVVGRRLSKLRVRHLLSMSVGHAGDSMEALFRAGDGDWVAAFLAIHLDHEPGRFFYYDTGASFVLSALVQKFSGERLLDYLRPRLFEPLGITSAVWFQNPQGIDFGGFGLCVTTRDIAALGELYRRGGEWGDRRLLPAEWVEQATAAQVDNFAFGTTADWRQGYGFQFWRSTHGYRGDGAFGQFCLVIPESDLVVAITSSLADLQIPLYPVWDLLPALADAPLAEDPDAVAGLAADVARLVVKAPTGVRVTDTARRLDAVRYELGANLHGFEAVSLHVRDDSTVIALRVGAVEHRIVVGFDDWHRHPLGLWPQEGAEFASRGAWVAEREFRARLTSTASPFTIDLEVAFKDDRTVRVIAREHVSFERVEPLVLRGRRVE